MTIIDQIEVNKALHKMVDNKMIDKSDVVTLLIFSLFVDLQRVLP